MSNGNQFPGDQQEGVVIDWSQLDALLALRKPGGPDPRVRLMTLYLTSSPELMDGIRAAVAASDGPSLAKAAHSLKSSSLNLGAMGLGASCAELEQIGKANALQDAHAVLEKAERDFVAVCAAFSEAMRESGD